MAITNGPAGDVMTAILPQPRTTFFGRADSLDCIRKRLGKHRLVTLTGVGGAGKTRLALHVAEHAIPGLADEVGWVELAPLADPRLVGPTACSSLDVRLTPDSEPREALIKQLQSGRWLVVLDNCEHVVDACAELVAAVLDRCPGLRVLATSREALGVPGEVAYPVPSLPMPDDDVPPDRQAESAMQAASVQLFVDRARAVRPAFRVTPANVGAMVRLCHRLEGLPLALELAAARVRLLTVEQIAERLDEGLGLPGGTGRQTSPRHRTMRAALDWSHNLLTAPERVLFRRLGVFGGPAGIEPYEAVCAGGELQRSNILELLARLIDQSLVVVDDRESAARYRLLEPVRRFAMEQLESSGELEAVTRRHAACYLELAQSIAPELQGPGRVQPLKRLESVHDNVRSAWDRALEAGDDRTVAGLARALFWFWHFQGHFSEGRTRSEEALEKLDPVGEARAVLLYTAGAMAWMQGDYPVARVRLEACVAECGEGRGGRPLPAALRELAGVRFALGEYPAAADLYEASIVRLRASESAWDLALALVMLADVRAALGAGDVARGLREEARRLFSRVGDSWGLSLAHFGLAFGAARAGELEAAKVNAAEALALQNAGGDDWNVGQILVLLGEIEVRGGRPGRAAERILESIEAFNRVGDRISLVHSIASLAEAERQRGRTLRAVRLAGAALAHADLLEGSYQYALATDQDRARTVEALRRAAGEEAFAREWAAGRAMHLDAAVAFALDVPEPRRLAMPGTGGQAALQVFALGPSAVYRSGRRLRAADWTFALPKALLFFLLVHGPRSKEQIGLEFWPEASTGQLKGRFRTTLYQLRRALGGTEWVLYRDGAYEFNRDLDYWLDVEAFESGLDHAMALLDADPAVATTALERAVDLYRGDFLEGEPAAPWVCDYRDRLRRRYREALFTLGRLRTLEGAHDLAADLYRRAVACDDLDERAHRELAHSLARGGDRAGALRHLDELAQLLRRELDAEPSADTLDFRARLEQGLAS